MYRNKMLVLFMCLLTWTYIEQFYTGQLSQFKKNIQISIYFCADTGFTAWPMG